jgi:hypothetical protein
MQDDAKRDEELATLTDRLLAGEEVEVLPELEDLAQVVRRIREVAPLGTHADPAYRVRLKRRLDQEWNLRYKRATHNWWNRRTFRLAVLAASLLVVLLVAVLLSIEGTDDGKTVQGTALGSLASAFLIVAAVVGIGLVVLWYWQRRESGRSKTKQES